MLLGFYLEVISEDIDEHNMSRCSTRTYTVASIGVKPVALPAGTAHALDGVLTVVRTS